MSALDIQVGGDHYKSMPIQPMEFSMANNMDACQHTVIKYVSRFREKGGIQDLEKAKHVIDMLIEFERKSQDAVKGLLKGNVYPFAQAAVAEALKPTQAAAVPAAQGEEPCDCLFCTLKGALEASAKRAA